MITVDELEETICVMLHQRGWVPDGAAWRYKPAHRRITRLIRDHVHDRAGPLAPSIKLDHYYVSTSSVGMDSACSCREHRQQRQDLEHPALLTNDGRAELEEHLVALETTALTLDLGDMLDCATGGPCRQHREEFRAYLIGLHGLDEPAETDDPPPDDHEPRASDLAMTYNSELGVVYSDLFCALAEADQYLARARGHAGILSTLNFDLPGELLPRDSATSPTTPIHQQRGPSPPPPRRVLDRPARQRPPAHIPRRLDTVRRSRGATLPARRPPHARPAQARATVDRPGPVDCGVTMTDRPRQPDPATTGSRGVAFLRPVPASMTSTRPWRRTCFAVGVGRATRSADGCSATHSRARRCGCRTMRTRSWSRTRQRSNSTPRASRSTSMIHLTFFGSDPRGVLPGGCPDHAVVERELSLHDLTEPMLDAALTVIEVQLDVDEVLEFIRCRLVGPCSE